MNNLIYSCQEITGSKATLKVIHIHLLLWNMASKSILFLNTDYSLIQNNFEHIIDIMLLGAYLVFKLLNKILKARSCHYM